MNESSSVYKLSLIRYMQQLAGLVMVDPCENKFLSTSEMEILREKVKLLTSLNRRAFDLDFVDKESVEFHRYINSLYQANCEPICIWLELSNICGPFKLDSLLLFNFGFLFEVIPEGIVVLVTQSGTDKLLLDWEEDNNGRRTISFEVMGEHWAKCGCPYPQV